MFLEKQIRLRVSKECEEKAEKLLRDYPLDYSNLSDVYRAGVFALYRWKKDYDRISKKIKKRSKK